MIQHCLIKLRSASGVGLGAFLHLGEGGVNRGGVISGVRQHCQSSGAVCPIFLRFGCFCVLRDCDLYRFYNKYIIFVYRYGLAR
jgi:hypothetical protein